MTDFFGFWERLQLEGLMPERALLRLRRARIPVYDVKKTEKNRILFNVKKKDIEKVFAIYPNVCYNKTVYGAYTVKRMGAVGVGKYAEFLFSRVGLLLGGALCFIVALAFQPFVFSIEVTGTEVYAREARIALDEAGIKPFARFRGEETDLVCAKLLALDGVEFCSVKKEGGRVIVEMQTSPFPERKLNGQSMVAKHSGELIALTVLRGTPLKKVGETVQAGETLAENCFYTEDGGQVRVEIIARARIACVWEEEIEAETKEEAFAKGYLAVGFSDLDELKKITVEEKGTLYRVRLEYEAVETWNF